MNIEAALTDIDRGSLRRSCTRPAAATTKCAQTCASGAATPSTRRSRASSAFRWVTRTMCQNEGHIANEGKGINLSC